MSERRACEVVGQPRGTQRYQPAEPDDEKALVKRMRELAEEHPRYGYRRVWALLRQEKFGVNKKRVHRLWRREGLRVRRRQRKRRRLGHSQNSCTRRSAEHRPGPAGGEAAAGERPAGGRERGFRFTSRILPPYLRKTRTIEELVPWLYLNGISTNDMSDALVLL